MTAVSHLHAPKTMDSTLPQHESLVHMLLAAVDAQPDLPAVIYEDRRITYAELGRAVAGFAQQLAAAGVKRGERVILLMANSRRRSRRRWSCSCAPSSGPGARSGD
jgi:acyl-CoA synthetase (AMP-forming)/AMP-acid ligase II